MFQWIACRFFDSKKRVFTTTTTVGYGDIVPTSIWGKVIAIITMHVGLLGLALPVTILGTNFSEIYHLRQEYKQMKKQNTLDDNAITSAAISRSLAHGSDLNENSLNTDNRSQDTMSATVCTCACMLYCTCIFEYLQMF